MTFVTSVVARQGDAGQPAKRPAAPRAGLNGVWRKCAEELRKLLHHLLGGGNRLLNLRGTVRGRKEAGLEL